MQTGEAGRKGQKVAFALDHRDIWSLTLLSTSNQEQDFILNTRSNRNPVQDISHEGGNVRL